MAPSPVPVSSTLGTVKEACGFACSATLLKSCVMLGMDSPAATSDVSGRGGTQPPSTRPVLAGLSASLGLSAPIPSRDADPAVRSPPPNGTLTTSGAGATAPPRKPPTPLAPELASIGKTSIELPVPAAAATLPTTPEPKIVDIVLAAAPAVVAAATHERGHRHGAGPSGPTTDRRGRRIQQQPIRIEQVVPAPNAGHRALNTRSLQHLFNGLAPAPNQKLLDRRTGQHVAHLVAARRIDAAATWRIVRAVTASKIGICATDAPPVEPDIANAREISRAATAKQNDRQLAVFDLTAQIRRQIAQHRHRIGELVDRIIAIEQQGEMLFSSLRGIPEQHRQSLRANAVELRNEIEQTRRRDTVILVDTAHPRLAAPRPRVPAKYDTHCNSAGISMSPIAHHACTQPTHSG